MAENVNNTVSDHVNKTSENWISQINAGNVTYDIATHHSITFKDGKNDGTGVEWNGLSDLEIVIPNITDIVQTPVEFAGTVGAGGVISWNTGHGEKPEKGNLVFVTSDCTFAEQACEAGDMAIYDGTNWKIVSGENQVQIVNTKQTDIDDTNRTVVKVGAAKDVLTVEGKALALTIDYADLNDNHLMTTKVGTVKEVIFDQTTEVDSIGIKLNKADDVTKTIGEEKRFAKATKLEDGTVDLKNATGLVYGIDWGEFNPGTKTDSKGNSEQNLTVTGGSLKPTTGQTSGVFVDSVKHDAVTFTPANLGEAGSIHMVTDIVTDGKGQKFVNGIHITGDDETADLTIAGYMTTEKAGVKFIEAWSDSTLAPVTSISDGGIELINTGTDFATGFGTETKSGDVVSSVKVTANNNTSVLNSATVENHVLSFGSTNVTSGVDTELGYKSLTKGAYKYTAPVATTTSFVSSGFTNVDDVKYTFGKAQETTYKTTTADWKLNTPELSVTYGSYSFEDDGMKANVPANTFIATVTAGELPSLADSTLKTVDVTGSVNTKLTTEEFVFNALKENTLTTSGAYSLESVAAGTDGSIIVGKAGALAAIKATVDVSECLTGVGIVESKS
jgi:hypothetical protein